MFQNTQKGQKCNGEVRSFVPKHPKGTKVQWWRQGFCPKTPKRDKSAMVVFGVLSQDTQKGQKCNHGVRDFVPKRPKGTKVQSWRQGFCPKTPKRDKSVIVVFGVLSQNAQKGQKCNGEVRAFVPKRPKGTKVQSWRQAFCPKTPERDKSAMVASGILSQNTQKGQKCNHGVRELKLCLYLLVYLFIY